MQPLARKDYSSSNAGRVVPLWVEYFIYSSAGEDVAVWVFYGKPTHGRNILNLG